FVRLPMMAASSLLWSGARCTITTYATPRFAGTASKNSRNASIPPADAPIPTTVTRCGLAAFSGVWFADMYHTEMAMLSCGAPKKNPADSPCRLPGCCWQGGAQGPPDQLIRVGVQDRWDPSLRMASSRQARVWRRDEPVDKHLGLSA